MRTNQVCFNTHPQTCFVISNLLQLFKGLYIQVLDEGIATIRWTDTDLHRQQICSCTCKESSSTRKE